MRTATNAVILVALLIVVALFYSTPSIWSATAQGNISVNVTVPITCNSSLTVHGKLVSDLTCNGTGLRIWTDNVTLDCDGHSITSNRTGIAIHIIGKNINITNCNVGRASIALKLGTDPSNVIIENSAFEDSDYGIFIENSTNITIRNITIRNNSIAGVLMNNTNSSFIYNNTFDRNRIGLDIISGTGNVVWYNNFLRSTNLQLAHVNATAGNHFNTTVSGAARGNNWSDTGSLKIYDSDADGYGDSGPDYPYSQAKGGFVLGAVEDWGPITTRAPPAPPAPLPSPCSIRWQCAEWSACVPNGTQSRLCINNGTCVLSPRTETQSCTYTLPLVPTCSDGIQNQGETGVDCGGPCPPCAVPAIEVPMPVAAPPYYIAFSLAMLAVALWILLNFIIPHFTENRRRSLRRRR